MRTAVLHVYLKGAGISLTHVEVKSTGGNETRRSLLEHTDVGDLWEQDVANFSAQFHASRRKFSGWLMASALRHAAAPSMPTGLAFVHRWPLS
jgi:hypothetical protein